MFCRSMVRSFGAVDGQTDEKTNSGLGVEREMIVWDCGRNFAKDTSTPSKMIACAVF